MTTMPFSSGDPRVYHADMRTSTIVILLIVAVLLLIAGSMVIPKPA